MSAKPILHRYLIRRKAELPVDPSELREHLASVAEKSRLNVTDADLDELAGITTAPMAKTGQNSGRKSKRRDNTTDGL